MGQSYFIWKDIDCRAMGCRLSAPAPIIRPEERVNHITIPGRSGDLTLLEGADVYNSYIQTVTLLAHGAERLVYLYKWLRGESYVTFSGEPDKMQKARIIGAITLNKHAFNLDWWTGEVQFYCQPLKEFRKAENVTITSSGSTVVNRGILVARPLFKVTVSGAPVVIASAGKQISLTGASTGSTVYIDSESMEAYTENRSALLTVNTTGDFPVLNPGSNSVTGSGWSALEITRRERFL